MWNGSVKGSVWSVWSLLLGAPGRRPGVWLLFRAGDGLGVKVEHPQRSEDERP